MTRLTIATVFLALGPLAACGSEVPTHQVAETASPEQALAAQTGPNGLTRLTMPDEDPGPPFYARVTSILNQFFHDEGWLAIPFYRPPSCVPADFNMLELFDFPGPEGPGALACPLLMHGFILIEPDAPLGTFPRQAVFQGGQVPFWFVRWSDFQAEAEDGEVTFAALEALERLTGTATQYHETLKPREGDHVIQINARGTLEDGRDFQFAVTHLEGETRSIRVRFR